MLVKGSPEVGVVWYEFAWFFVNSGCEEMQLEYGYVWIYFFLFISPSTQAVPYNHAEYQQSFSLSIYNGFHIFSPYLFLYGYHGFCFGFQNTEIDVIIY